MEQPKKFAMKMGVVWLALILFFPVGIFLLWKFAAKPLMKKRLEKPAE